ncbi:MAG: 2OG-Fe(II) oxygenase family protein [Thermoplasmatales archaeon]
MNAIPVLNPNDICLGQKLLHAFQTIGFVALENDNLISKPKLAAAYGIASYFFNLPLEQKMRYYVEGSFGQYGYTPFGTEKAKDQKVADLKEFLQYANNHNDVEFDGDSEFVSNTFKSLHSDMRKVAITILSQLMKTSHFSELVTQTIYKDVLGQFNNNSILRVIHYPPTGPNPSGIRSAAHEDINLITILPAASAAGLQVLSKDGQWVDAPTDPNFLIVNVGDMLQELTNYDLKSTTHRVINTKEGEGTSRYSMPFFFHPNSDVRLSERYTAGEYLDQRLREIGLKK